MRIFLFLARMQALLHRPPVFSRRSRRRGTQEARRYTTAAHVCALAGRASWRVLWASKAARAWLIFKGLRSTLQSREGIWKPTISVFGSLLYAMLSLYIDTTDCKLFPLTQLRSPGTTAVAFRAVSFSTSYGRYVCARFIP